MESSVIAIMFCRSLETYFCHSQTVGGVQSDGSQVKLKAAGNSPLDVAEEFWDVIAQSDTVNLQNIQRFQIDLENFNTLIRNRNQCCQDYTFTKQDTYGKQAYDIINYND